MENETKEALYMLLDIINSFERIINSCDNSAEQKLSKVKNEIYNLINNYHNLNEVVYCDNQIQNNSKKGELIGVLPQILIDREKFPKNGDIATLAKRSLNLKIKNWNKKSRNELIGLIISDVATKNEKEMDIFLNAWKLFNQGQELNIEERIKNDSDDFLETWLSFFENFKKER